NNLTVNKSDTGAGLGSGLRRVGVSAAGAGTFAGNLSINAITTLHASAGAIANFTGVIQNGADTGNTSHSVIISGGGTVQYLTNPTYSGTTTVSAGTLLVNATHSGGGAYTIATGAALGGSGTIAPAADNNVTINGVVSPGNSPGNLTLNTSGTGATVLPTAGTYVWEINNQTGTPGTNWDTLTMSAVSVTAGNTPGQQFVIQVVSLNPANNQPCQAPRDANSPGRWTIATAQVGAFLSNLDRFKIDTTTFQNVNSGGFQVDTSG